MASGCKRHNIGQARLHSLGAEVLNGVGVDGVGVIFPFFYAIFPSFLRVFPLFSAFSPFSSLFSASAK